MHWFGFVLVGLVILTSACGGGTGDEGAPDEGNATDPAQERLETDPVRDALESELKPALLRDFPLLKEEEASCISDAILEELPDFGTALEDPASFAAEILSGTQAAQERCLAPDRIAELLDANQTVVLTSEPAEKAFLLLVRGVAGGLNTEDQELVDAGYLVCALAEEAGSLETLVARLAATPVASAKIAADLLPLLGRVLRAEELITFSTTAVVALCPEISDSSSAVSPP